MKLKNLVLVAFVLFLIAATAQAQQRPLITEDVDIVPQGSVRIGAGVDFLQNAKFRLSGLQGDLTRVGVIEINAGFAPNISFELAGTLQNFLAINSATTPSPIPLSLAPNANSANDIGDFSLAAKIKLRNETSKTPALGFKFGFQLPNSNQARGLGTNQNNIFGLLLIGKKFGRQYQDKTRQINLFGNLGVGILPAPLERFTQNDVLLYGLAGIFRVNNRFNLVSEVNGRASTRSGLAPLGTESQGEFRLGTQIKASGLRFDAAGTIGLTKYSPRSGVTFGVTYQSPTIFTPAQ
ncbi:MAG: hypothetical protein ABI954_14920 [Pyrinomonadaceae bacterium]